ncbi:MAG: hypothetical protein GXP14_05650 [Gammaproteobacteria bacterium]|nr:hypothetical protein [Gammaproteobacteria bacterium]
MRKIIYLMTCLFSVAVFAEGNSGMQMDMQQKMMEQLKKAQNCMQNIDSSVFDKLEQEGKKMDAEVKLLCADGQRDEAQKKAMDYAKEVMNRPAIKKMKKCSEILDGMASKMPFDDIDKKFQDRHVCDEI